MRETSFGPIPEAIINELSASNVGMTTVSILDSLTAFQILYELRFDLDGKPVRAIVPKFALDILELDKCPT